MSEIEKQAEILFQEISFTKVGIIPAEVIREWKKLGELLYRQNRPTSAPADLSSVCPECDCPAVKYICTNCGWDGSQAVGLPMA